MANKRVPLGHKPRGRQVVKSGRRPTEQGARVYARSGPGTQASITGVFAPTMPGRLPTNSGGAGLARFLGGAGATAGGSQPFAGFFRSPFYATPVPPVAEAPRLAPVFTPARPAGSAPVIHKRAMKAGAYTRRRVKR